MCIDLDAESSAKAMHNHEFTLAALFSSRPHMQPPAAFGDEHHRPG
jgi:hypothetical protein